MSSRQRVLRRGIATRGSRAVRCGFTLIELLVVLTVFTFMLSAVALAIAVLLRAQSRLQQELAASATVSRLAAQLRIDAHQAASVTVLPASATSGEGIRLAVGDQQIEYVSRAHRLTRASSRGAEPLHRETFVLPEGGTFTWQIPARPDEQLLTLTIANTTFDDIEAPSETRRIEAVIGLYQGDVR